MAPTDQYEVTLPDGTVTGPYLTTLEARRDVRAAGGGTIRRVSTKPATEELTST